MWYRVGALSLVAAASLMLLAACGGDDSTAQKKTRENAQGTAVAVATATATSSSGAAAASVSSAATPVPGSSSSAATPVSTPVASGTVPLDCGQEIRSYRFDGKVALQEPSSASANDPAALASALLQDVRFSGAYVSPDRVQIKLDLGGQSSPLAGQSLQFIQIGSTAYIKLGNLPWQKQEMTEENPIGNLNPIELCKQLQENLPVAQARTRKEQVNGVDAIRYDFDRKSLEKLPGLFGEDSQDLPENLNLSLWVAEKEKFPVRMALSGSGQQAGGTTSINLEFNVTDLNASGIRIDAPQ